MPWAVMRPLPLLVLAGLMFVGAGSAWAQLTASSPFVPPQVAGAVGPVQPVPLEFAGYLSSADGLQFVVRDPTKKISSFLRLNESDPNLGVVVKKHDMSENTLVVEYQGKPLTLEVRKAKIVSSGRPPMAMPVPPPVVNNYSGMTSAVTQSVVANPTPADEQKRLEAVTAEVERRRQAREQAQQPGVAAPATR